MADISENIPHIRHLKHFDAEEGFPASAEGEIINGRSSRKTPTSFLQKCAFTADLQRALVSSLFH